MRNWSDIISPGEKAAKDRLKEAKKTAADTAKHPHNFTDLGDFASDQATDIAALWQNKRTRKQAVKEIRALQTAFSHPGETTDGTAGMTLTRLQARGIPVELKPPVSERLKDTLWRLRHRSRKK